MSPHSSGSFWKNQSWSGEGAVASNAAAAGAPGSAASDSCDEEMGASLPDQAEEQSSGSGKLPLVVEVPPWWALGHSPFSG